MDETQIAYGIKPVRKSGKIVFPGSFSGNYATWKPKFGEMEQERRRTNSAGHTILMAVSDSYDAIAWENGDIVVTIEAFKSPGYLAAVINHETIHFEQMITPVRGHFTTASERERAAYNMMQGLTNRRFFQLTSTELALIKERFEHAMLNAEASPNAMMAGGSSSYSIDLTENPDGEELLRNKLQEALDSAAMNRKRIELAKDRDLDERLTSRIIDLAKRTCASPGSVTQEELDALPSPRNPQNIQQPTFGSNCERAIFDEINAGSMAGTLKRRATPGKALPIQAEPEREKVQPARGYPPPTAVVIVAGVPLSTVLLELKQQAELACQNQGRILVERNLFNPPGRYFQEPRNEQTVADIKAGLGFCEGHVFQRFFEMLREERGKEITERWLIDTVESAPTGAVQGGGGSNPCERNGDPFGCQPRR